MENYTFSVTYTVNYQILLLILAILSHVIWMNWVHFFPQSYVSVENQFCIHLQVIQNSFISCKFWVFFWIGYNICLVPLQHVRKINSLTCVHFYIYIGITILLFFWQLPFKFLKILLHHFVIPWIEVILFQYLGLLQIQKMVHKKSRDLDGRILLLSVFIQS